MNKIKKLLKRIKAEIKHFSIKRFLTKLYYRIVYGIDFGIDGSVLPKTGSIKNGYSVEVKGAYLDIKDKSGETFRIVPNVESLGFYLELLTIDEKVKFRRNVTTNDLREMLNVIKEASE